MLIFLILLITATTVSDIAFVDDIRIGDIKQEHAVYMGYIPDDILVDIDEEYPCNDAAIFPALEYMERMEDYSWELLYPLFDTRVTAVKSVDKKTFERTDKWLTRINVSDELIFEED